MKSQRILSLLLLVASASFAFGQGVVVAPQTALKSVNGVTMPIAGATITVCAANTGGIPCSPALVNAIFRDAALTQPLTNPFFADSAGNYQFAIAAGTYTVTVTASGFAGYSYQTTAGGSGTGTGSVVGTPNQIAVSGNVISIATNPVVPGNPTLLGQLFTGLLGNSGIFPQAGAISGTGYLCLDANANFTNIGCPAITATAAGVASEVQFRNSGTGGLAADSPFNYNSGTHTLSVSNMTVGTQNITGAQNFSFPYQLTSTIPGSPLATGSAGNSGININTDGFFCMWVNGGSCQDLAVTGGTSIIANPGTGISQNIVQPLGTQFSANNFANTRYVTASWNWSQSVTVNLSSAGSGKTITLTPCPLGIDTSANANKPFTVHLTTTNTEDALVTGGTCTSGAASGTVIVTTTLAHSATTNAISSSYSGIQEALNDAGTPGASVVIPDTGANANALPVYSTIYLQSNKSTLRGEGKATLLCQTRSVCIFAGDRVNSNDFTGITISTLRFATGNTFDGLLITNTACASNVSTITLGNTGANAVAVGDFVDVNWTFNNHFLGVHQVATASATQFTYTDTNCGGLTTIASQATAGFASLENAAIETNALGTKVLDVWMASTTEFGSWGNWQNHIVVDNDQAFVLNGLDMSKGPHCTANYCGQSVYAPGPFSVNAAVLWLSHMNLSLNCSGNAITAWNGNTLSISNSVIQGYQQWGVHTGTMRGGFGSTLMHDVYEESSTSCTNPLYGSYAQTGVLNMNAQIKIAGGEGPAGLSPQFAATGNQGQTYNYGFVVHDSASGSGTSRVFPFGIALVDSVTPTGSIVVKWPRVQGTGTITYDVLRWAGSLLTTAFPYNGNCGGGSTSACGSISVGQAQCSTILCSFTDTASNNTASYAVSNQGSLPGMFWLPGGLVDLQSGDQFGNTSSDAHVHLDNPNGAQQSGQSFYFSAETRVPAFTATECPASGTPGDWISCLTSSSSGGNGTATATVLQTGLMFGTPGTTNVKGRLNFFVPPTANEYTQALITLCDSNPVKTLGTAGNRPVADANDCWIGIDGGTTPATAQIAFGAPVSFDWCIAQTPANCSANALINLAAALLTFKVAITTNQQITSTVSTGTAPFSVSSTTRVGNLTTSGNVLLEDCGSTTTCAKTVLLNTFMVKGKVTLAAGTATVTSLPFAGTTWQCWTADTTTAANASSMVEATATTGTVTGTGTDVISYQCSGN